MKIISLLILTFICQFQIVFSSYSPEELIQHIHNSVLAANVYQSQLNQNPNTLKIPGMTGLKYRHFLNNLLTMPDVSYLEVGCWRGSTTVAALYNNHPTVTQAIVVDNFSEFQDPTNSVSQSFFQNKNFFLNQVPLKFIDKDAFLIDVKKEITKPINVYFYDGNHSFESHKLAFSHFHDAFDDVFIALVDDFGWPGVAEPTKEVIREMGYQVLYWYELGTGSNYSDSNASEWWNGLLITVLKKNK